MSSESNLSQWIREASCRSRPDTMRTIINFITTEKPGDSGHTTTLMMDEEHFANANDEYVIMEEDNRANRWFQWKPDPYDADPRKPNASIGRY